MVMKLILPSQSFHILHEKMETRERKVMGRAEESDLEKDGFHTEWLINCRELCANLISNCLVIALRFRPKWIHIWLHHCLRF